MNECISICLIFIFEIEFDISEIMFFELENIWLFIIIDFYK